MDDALRAILAAHLRVRGFTGSPPHFRRREADRISLLSVQHFSSGGSFVVEVAVSPSAGHTTSWGRDIPASKVKAIDITAPRPRLGAPGFPERGDHWFVYGPRTYEPDGNKVLHESHYAAIAAEVVSLLDEQAEPFWRSTSV